MSSLKMTFSLTSLILIIAFGLVFAPTTVMAHDLIDDEDGDQHETGVDLTDHAAHPILDSVTAAAPAADGFVNATTSFVVTFVFSGAAPTDFDVADVSGLSTVATAVDFTASADGLTYTARVTMTTTGDITLSSSEVANLYVDSENTDATLSITIDNTSPTVTNVTANVLEGNTYPQDEVWTEGFEVMFNAMDESAGSGIGSPSDFSVTAEPANITFGTVTRTGTTAFKATGTLANTAAADSEAVDITITVTVTDKADNASVSAVTVGTHEPTLMVKLKRPVTSAEDDSTDDPDPSPGLGEGDTRRDVTAEATFDLKGTLEPGKFLVFSAVDNSDADSMVIANLPNIQRFFARGGTISLVGPAGTKAKTVVITEIMWALNLAAAPNMQADLQWIEVYNTDNKNADGKGTATPANADLTKYKLVFTPGTVVPKPANLSDQVSNVELLGWDVNIGQSGRVYTGDADAVPDTFVTMDIVSMYRNFKYEDLTKVHNKDDATKNRNGQLGVIPSGNTANGWAPSTVNDTYAVNQLGSPGAMHFVGRNITTATDATYGVVINEVGNNQNDDYDWIELLNTGTGNANLQKWEITKLTGHNAETALVTFPDNDKHQIGPGEVLLIVNKDPYRDPDHPLAAGTKINHGATRDEKTGISSRYYVGGLVLDNSGAYALLLRSANDKEKSPDNVVDFTGGKPFNNIQDTSSTYRTNRYPLRGQSAGGGDVFKDLDEDFRSGRVYWRHKTNTGVADDTWRKAGYSGVGYKRGGSGDGTPGYPNNVVKNNQTELAAASTGATVTISEIMYDRGDRDNLPQWIELYNSSNTHAVNLNEWKLKIENADDAEVRTPAVTIANLGGTIIQPNQTVLIVSYTTGRVSRGSQGGVDFPASRVISLSGKGELEIADNGGNRRNYRLLSKTAFKLSLFEKGNATDPIDVVGNMGADPAWELPMAENGTGRSSVIRRYNTGNATGPGVERGSGEGMAQDATTLNGWILAADSDLSEVRVNETFYGNPDDVGTPGYRGGGALPVSLSKFRPERLKDTGEIVVRWITESELNNAGFNILRSDKRDGEFTKVHFRAGQGTTSERTVYEWKDTSAKPNVVYYYQIQDVSLDGEVTTLRTTHLRGNVTAVGKATTTWGEIKALQ